MVEPRSRPSDATSQRCARLVRGLDCASASVSVADLIDLHQDRVGDAFLDAIREPRHVRHHQVVADQLTLVADQVGDALPALKSSSAMPSSIEAIG